MKKVNTGVCHPWILGIVLAAAAMASCNRSICVMTYNVGAFSKYQENSTPGVAAAVRAAGAAAVSLNELDSCNRRHEVYQLEEFAREMGGWQYHFASAFPFAGGGYGNGVATSDGIIRSFRIDLPKGDGSEPRSVAVVETEDYVFASTHLDYLAETAAIAQADVINNWFTEHYFGSRKPVFLCGDMNAEPGSKVIGALSRCWEILSSDSPTYPCAPSTRMAGGLGTFANEEAQPKMCIDYIMRFRSAGDATVENTGVLTFPPGTMYGVTLNSDHYPVYAMLRIKKGQPSGAAGTPAKEAVTFSNPVIPQNWPDPTIWEHNGTFYSVATGVRTILTSTDLVHWTDSGKAPLSREAYQKARSFGRNFWAPDVVKIGRKWMLYLTCYNSDRDCGIFAFSSDAPDGPFEFVSKITHSKDTGIKDTIDPEVVAEKPGGQLWLYYGSVGRVHRIKLDKTGTAPAEGAEYELVAGMDIDTDPSRQTVFEGSYLHKHGSWWYLFVSSGHFGDGSYRIRVGRSRTLDGEFLDRDARKMSEGFGTVILSSDAGDRFYGPGHNGEIFTDRKGRDYMLYHCHDAEASRRGSRSTLAQRIYWDEDGWPFFKTGKPLAIDESPIF